MTRIQFSSNLVNAVYIILFDILLPIFFAWFIAILISSYNLKIIHDDRKHLSVQQIPFPLLFNRGVTTRLVGLSVAVSSFLIAILAITGSFSINGVSKVVVREKQVPFVVDRALPGQELDFRDLVSEEGEIKEPAYWALYYTQNCLSVRKTGISVFSSYIDKTEVPESEWSEEFIVNKTICRMESGGYKEKLAFLQETKQRPPGTEFCDFNLGDAEIKGLMKVNASVDSRCPFQLHDTWCAHMQTWWCAGSIETDNGFSYMVKNYPMSGRGPTDSLFYQGEPFIEAYFLKEGLRSEAARSLVYLLGVNVAPHPSLAGRMSILTTLRNQEIGENDTVEETEIDDKLLTVALTSIIFVTVGIATAALFARIFYRTRLGRAQYNSFLSATDMLSCAINEVKAERTSAFKSSGTYAVKVVDGEPFLYEVGQEKDAHLFHGV